MKFEQGKMLGKMENLGFQLQEQAVLETFISLACSDVPNWYHASQPSMDYLIKAAIVLSDSILKNVLNKAKFWEQHADKALNQRKGKLTSIKWAKITKCSQDTATRDINHLIALGVLVKSKAGGRSTSYLLMAKV